jgi:hypothetical protein
MKYKDICLMIPSYMRVRNGRLPKIVESAVSCASSHKMIRFCFCINERDDETAAYVKQLQESCPVETDVVIENLLQPNLSAYFNMMYDKTRFDGAETLVSMLGDDMVFLTEGYDLAILKEINAYEGKGFVWCNDDYIARERLCVNLFTTRLMVEGTERPFMCPLFNADLIDDVWM